MFLYFLGTGAGKPSLERNVTSVALKLPESINESWLFDCGEGTQHQLLRSPFSLNQITRIFITHLHGDHIFGLPGLLASRSFASNERSVTVYGPSGIKEFLANALRISETNLSYQLLIKEIEDSKVIDIEDWQVRTKAVDHDLPSFTYRVEEPDTAGRLDVEKLRQLQIPPGPIYGKLKQGKTVRLDDGTLLEGSAFIGPPRRGRHVVISGDTRYSQASVDLSKQADVLVHEATFGASLTARAHLYFHSTTTQAAWIAKEAMVGQLVLTHLSSRYRDKDYPKLLNQANIIFPNTVIAKDHFRLEIAKSEKKHS